MSSLGSNIKQLRERENISQKDFAQKLGVSNVVLSRYEKDERKPDYDMLKKIADYFEVSIDFLLGREEKTMAKEDTLEEVNKLVKEYGIEQFGFFDIEKWKDLSQEDIEEIKKHFEYVVFQAKQRNKN
ncbi:helix-turn-helix domain-containing protein [Rossellomorea vietnamensis]|uniref:Helix-turn-helix domain-containing protein n=1 Tax=Rossellomorea vietnamensis TaxID=218284 RepID=A0ACD4C7L2_9BACI|nr:helix-turn-helix domain-containing protein [Rossellomorea vietnamensis]UXH44432.1 helix-turn-helix domain-containing protein [Rossellomorea vietnamensis]